MNLYYAFPSWLGKLFLDTFESNESYNQAGFM
jgi:hypothetical protein